MWRPVTGRDCNDSSEAPDRQREKPPSSTRRSCEADHIHMPIATVSTLADLARPSNHNNKSRLRANVRSSESVSVGGFALSGHLAPAAGVAGVQIELSMRLAGLDKAGELMVIQTRPLRWNLPTIDGPDRLVVIRPPSRRIPIPSMGQLVDCVTDQPDKARDDAHRDEDNRHPACRGRRSGRRWPLRSVGHDASQHWLRSTGPSPQPPRDGAPSSPGRGASVRDIGVRGRHRSLKIQGESDRRSCQSPGSPAADTELRPAPETAESCGMALDGRPPDAHNRGGEHRPRRY
jgi:hypothetical protein